MIQGWLNYYSTSTFEDSANPAQNSGSLSFTSTPTSLTLSSANDYGAIPWNSLGASQPPSSGSTGTSWDQYTESQRNAVLDYLEAVIVEINPTSSR